MTSHAEILHAHLPRNVYWKSHTARANLELLCLFPVLFLFVALPCFLLALFQQLWPIQLASFAIQCTLVCPEFCWKSRALREHLELLCSVSYVVSSRCSAVVFVVHAIHTAETKCRSTFQIRSVKRLLMSKLLLLQNPNVDATPDESHRATDPKIRSQNSRKLLPLEVQPSCGVTVVLASTPSPTHNLPIL